MRAVEYNVRNFNKQRRIESHIKGHQLHTVIIAGLKTSFRQGSTDKDTIRIIEIQSTFKTGLKRARAFVKFESCSWFASKDSQRIPPGLFTFLCSGLDEVVTQRLDVSFRTNRQTHPSHIDETNAEALHYMSRLEGYAINRKLADKVETCKRFNANIGFKGNAHLTNPSLESIGLISSKNDFVGVSGAARYPGRTQHTTGGVHRHRTFHSTHCKLRDVTRQQSSQKLFCSLHLENRHRDFIEDHQIQSHFFLFFVK